MYLTKLTFIALVTAVLFIAPASGQSPKIDSLEGILKTHNRSDTARVNLLNNLAYELFNRDQKQAIDYAKQSMELSSQLNYAKGKAASLWVSGLISLQSDKNKSLDLFREAFKIAKKIDDKAGMCNYLTAIGNVMQNLGDLKECNRVYEQALQIALKLDDKQLIIKCRINISRQMDRCGNPVEAVQHLQEIITLAEEIDDKTSLAQTYSNLAFIYRRQGNAPTALEYYLSALQLNEKTNNTRGIFLNLAAIAGIQSDQNASEAALETIHRALKLSQTERDSAQMSICMTNIGNIYQRTGNPKAIDYFRKALSLSNGSNIGQNINNLMNIGSIYTARGEFELAISNFNEALASAQKFDKKSAMGEVYITIGALYLKQQRYGLAIDFIQKALQLAEITHYTELQKDCSQMLSKVYAATGKFNEAYTYHKQYKLLYDTLYNEKATRKIALLESSYKFNKERQVYELEKASQKLRIKSQQQTILSLVVTSVLIILLSLVAYRSGKLKKKVLQLEIDSINRELEANQKAMAVAKLQLVQNAERDLHNVKMLEDIGKRTLGEEHTNLCSMISDYKLQAHHSNWEEFETLFTKINTTFWDKLNELNSTLTPNERKLCAFLKLNMSNKDIALITFQSEEALKKSRLRLRKKLNLDRSINLTTFIHTLSD
ncbi:MAG: tetratricopeptide repeat protein [Alistipes sp.]